MAEALQSAPRAQVESVVQEACKKIGITFVRLDTYGVVLGKSYFISVVTKVPKGKRKEITRELHDAVRYLNIIHAVKIV